MRTLVTFILRLWIDPQADPAAWEGRVECIADGARAHVRGGEELLQFVKTHVAPPRVPHQEKKNATKGGNR